MDKTLLGKMLRGTTWISTSFLIYINDIPDGLKSNVKIFADDTSLFANQYDNIITSNDLNYDIK